MSNKHSFHIVDLSPWPLLVSINLSTTMLNTIIIIDQPYNWHIMYMYLSLFSFIICAILWWRDILREGSMQGHHTWNVYNGMKISMILFISSEVMFFLSIFWAFFHFSLSPDWSIGNTWPPMNIIMLNPYQMPLMNTVILLSSGTTVTACHYQILNKNYKSSMFFLLLTITLGLIFSTCQFWEYLWAEFTMESNIFGSSFFMSTGFHGLHVIIGTLFLMTNAYRLMMSSFNQSHHFSFEAAAWYWHFVDVVWIYLYIFVYWWFFFLINMM